MDACHICKKAEYVIRTDDDLPICLDCIPRVEEAEEKRKNAQEEIGKTARQHYAKLTPKLFQRKSKLSPRQIAIIEKNNSDTEKLQGIIQARLQYPQAGITDAIAARAIFNAMDRQPQPQQKTRGLKDKLIDDFIEYSGNYSRTWVGGYEKKEKRRKK